MSYWTKTKNQHDASARSVSSNCATFTYGVALFVATWTLSGPAVAQEEDAARYVPGIIGRYTDHRGIVLERVEETIGNWADETPLGMTPGRPFGAAWRGYVFVRPEGSFQFRAYFHGSLKLSIDGRPIIEVEQDRDAWRESAPIELEYGWRRLEVTFDAAANSSPLVVAWSGPGFASEPLTSRHLYHDAHAEVDDRLDVGVRLMHDLRCSACHEINQRDWPSRAPSLTHVVGNLDPAWMVQWLTDRKRSTHASMPSFALPREQAVAIARHLTETSLQTADVESIAGNAEAGKQLFLSIGCLACHQWRSLGPEPSLGTIDLTHIADKRSRPFFDVYLRQPAKINADHQMPVFDLQPEERNDLATFLDSLHGENKTPKPTATHSERAAVGNGKALIDRLRCTACHQTNQEAKAVVKTAITANSDWERSCLDKPDLERGRPGYHLTPEEQAAIRHTVSVYTSTRLTVDNRRGMEVLRSNRCLSCHPRGSSRGIELTALSVANEDRQLAPFVPALTPPSLNRTGDKLRRDTLDRAIQRDGPRRRPWLKVRMPRFRLGEGQLQSLVDALVRADQFPRRSTAIDQRTDTQALEHAGARLVTASGFGCTSCHAIGGVQPPDAPLNARAPDLAGLGQRVHRDWFDAWVRNPTRIVPRIEMPSISVAVPGVLDQNLDHQLQAVWHVLNQPDFRPPQPNPIRVVRRSGSVNAETAVVLTDVLQSRNRWLIKPFLVALPNRHNVVFDLESGQLYNWSIGDAAYQRTRGKSWFWELAGTAMLTSDDDRSDLALVRKDQLQHAHSVGQFVTGAEAWRHIAGGVEFSGILEFSTEDRSQQLKMVQRFVSADSPERTGWRRDLSVAGTDPADEWRLRVVPSNALEDASWSGDRRAITLPSGTRIRIASPTHASFDRQGYVIGLQPNAAGDLKVVLCYSTLVPVDRFPPATKTPLDFEPSSVNVVPGFHGIRLPITDQMMPTGIDWRPNGNMLVTSLKGRVWSVRDSDGDGIEETATPFSDELAAPFGVAAWKDHVDIVNKFGLLRLFDDNHDGFAERVVTLADGWGHTDDYHDWAVGLPRTNDGSYYVALSCQQDERSEAAAHLRGRVLRLTPQSVETNRPHSYAVREVSAGHRFPIGIALSRNGQLFVTDNQGNYNPYNELNHVRAGAHFGFVNKLDSGHNTPPLTSPAVNIPHPWTRSVNGICFLDTPPTCDRSVFGPFEGHLIGCEYDTRRLIRLTLQQVGSTMQGAAYPFSLDPGEDPRDHGFLGPLTAAVSPRGELYVGDIRDSGWGGGPNHGAIVRLTPNFRALPPGMAEVTAVDNGFVIRFTKAVDRNRAADPTNYNVSSVTRVSTPAYGGPDQDRSTETIVNLDVGSGGRRVRIVLDDLKPGYVYDFRLKNLTDEPLFYPAVAFYTLNALPEEANSTSD